MSRRNVHRWRKKEHFNRAIVNLAHVHTSNNVEATFDFVAKNGNNVERVLL